MKTGWQGALALLLAMGAAILNPPQDPLGLLVMLLAGASLELFQVRLSDSLIFSPALPVWLGAAMVPQVGPVVPLLLLVGVALWQTGRPLTATLASRLGSTGAVIGIVVSERLGVGILWVDYLIGLAVFLLLQWNFVHPVSLPKVKAEKALWYAIHLRIRPLELGFASASVGVVATYQYASWSILFLVPLLATGRLAAETVLLKAHDATLGGVLQQLQQVTVQARNRESTLLEERKKKRLLEGFTDFLSAKPDLEHTGQSLVQTLVELIPADNICLFLGDPALPFAYRCRATDQTRVQGANLNGLTEPVVLKARTLQKPVHQREAPDDANRLFPEDTAAVGLPVGKEAVLYLGRVKSIPFSSDQLKTLSWLARKAELALNLAYQEQRERLQRQHLTATVGKLEDRIAWMNLLVQSTERLLTTLETRTLLVRQSEVLQKSLPHQAGVTWLGTGVQHQWGEAPWAPEVFEAVKNSPRTLLLQDLQSTPLGSHLPTYGSLLASRIGDQHESLGCTVLLARESFQFTEQQANFLFLVCSQTGMSLGNATLFQEVVTARRQLEESQAGLIQSSKMTAMGQLAAGVAHELNSPLGAISLSLEESLRLLQTDPGLAQSMLQLAQEAVERSKEIVDRLMGYTRSPLGRFEKLDLGDLISETLPLIGPQLRALGVVIEWQAPPSPILVQGEKQSLQQVLLNLLLNGAQSTEEQALDRRRISLRLQTDKRRVVLSIKDSGRGIAVEHQSRIFDPFYTTKPVGKGTGLGLWVCHQIVTEHKGEIALLQSGSEGTTFTVALPWLTA